MKICIYIPCRNGADFLPEVFAAIASQTRTPYLRLLVDDQSSDATADLGRRANWDIVTTTPDRCGLSAARNTAITAAHQAGCDVLAGIDADAVPARDYIEQLEAFLFAHPDVSGVCGCMRERFFESPSDRWRSVHMRQHWGEQPFYDPPILFGSSAAHRIIALRALNGFNESLRTNYEDTDLTQRLLAAKHRLAYVPSMRSEHLKRDTPDSVLRMFWSWFLPPSVLSGHFETVDAWLRGRLPWIWADYRSRSRGDDSMTLLTVALPWVQISRDLQVLCQRLGQPADVKPLAAICFNMLVERGFGRANAEWTAQRVRYVTQDPPGSSLFPLNPIVLNAIAAEASGSLPRRSFWTGVEESARTLGIAEMAT